MMLVMKRAYHRRCESFESKGEESSSRLAIIGHRMIDDYSLERDNHERYRLSIKSMG